MTDEPEVASPRMPPVPGAGAAQTPQEEAAALRARADELDPPEDSQAPPEHMLLKVAEPHVSFEFGGSRVFQHPSPVHRSLVPGLMQSAAEAGVTIIAEEG